MGRPPGPVNSGPPLHVMSCPGGDGRALWMSGASNESLVIRL